MIRGLFKGISIGMLPRVIKLGFSGTICVAYNKRGVHNDNNNNDNDNKYLVGSCSPKREFEL